MRLVTGVTGFVGGHLAEHLIDAGDLVVGLSARAVARPLGPWGADVRLEPCDLETPRTRWPT